MRGTTDLAYAASLRGTDVTYPLGRLNTYGGGGFNEVLPSLPVPGRDDDTQTTVRTKLAQVSTTCYALSVPSQTAPYAFSVPVSYTHLTLPTMQCVDLGGR
eukprot:686156-Rhodomonas_salina.1